MAGTVVIRFYAELGELVPAVHRPPLVSYRFDVAPSVKAAVEGLGVPHTEVDLLLVDGEPATFDHRLADGERVAVYPAFRTIDVGPVTRVRPTPLPELRFVADVHVAALARRLRVLGFDVRADSDADDEALATTAQDEGRVLLTRDRGLLQRSSIVHGVLVHGDDPDEQLIELVRRLHLGGAIRPFTRCPTCNGLLQEVDRELVLDQLEPGTATTHDQFRRCVDCGQVYWPGAHHPRLQALVDRTRSAGS